MSPVGSLAGQTVLVTGAAGCIGAWVVRQLTELGGHPVVLDLSENRARLDLIMDTSADVTWITGDITDYDTVRSVVAKHSPTAIIHLAALQVPYCKEDPLLGTRVNVMGTAHMLEAAREFGIKRFAFASSIAAPAMGDNDHLATLYGAHKVCNEQMASVYWQDWQVPSICIRPGVIYGPGRDRGMSAAPTLAMLSALFDQPYTIPFSGPVAFVHVADAACRFIKAVSSDIDGAHVFDMQGTEADIADLAALIATQIQGADIAVTGAPLPFPHAPDNGSLDALIGAQPYLSLRDGIAQTLSTFQAAREKGTLSRERATAIIEANS